MVIQLVLCKVWDKVQGGIHVHLNTAGIPNHPDLVRRVRQAIGTVEGTSRNPERECTSAEHRGAPIHCIRCATEVGTAPCCSHSGTATGRCYDGSAEQHARWIGTARSHTGGPPELKGPNSSRNEEDLPLAHGGGTRHGRARGTRGRCSQTWRFRNGEPELWTSASSGLSIHYPHQCRNGTVQQVMQEMECNGGLIVHVALERFTLLYVSFAHVVLLDHSHYPSNARLDSHVQVSLRSLPKHAFRTTPPSPRPNLSPSTQAPYLFLYWASSKYGAITYCRMMLELKLLCRCNDDCRHQQRVSNDMTGHVARCFVDHLVTAPTSAPHSHYAHYADAHRWPCVSSSVGINSCSVQMYMYAPCTLSHTLHSTSCITIEFLVTVFGTGTVHYRTTYFMRSKICLACWWICYFLLLNFAHLFLLWHSHMLQLCYLYYIHQVMYFAAYKHQFQRPPPCRTTPTPIDIIWAQCSSIIELVHSAWDFRERVLVRYIAHLEQHRVLSLLVVSSPLLCLVAFTVPGGANIHCRQSSSPHYSHVGSLSHYGLHYQSDDLIAHVHNTFSQLFSTCFFSCIVQQYLHSHICSTHATSCLHTSGAHVFSDCSQISLQPLAGRLPPPYIFDDLGTQLLISGLPPHPGPQDDTFDFEFLIQNVTSLAAYLPSVISRPFDACFCQEISIPWRNLSDTYAAIKSHSCKGFLTGPDPELAHTGGVGTIYRPRLKFIRLRPVTQKLQQCIDNGRVQLVALMLPHDVLLVIANVYCWTNGHQDTTAAMRSDDLLHAIFSEFDALPEGPKMLVGDLNADPSDLPTLQTHLDAGSYLDLGAQAHIYDQPSLQPTCYPPNHIHPSRRDFVIVSGSLFPFVKAFQVHELQEIPVHASLRVRFSFPHLRPKKTVLKKSPCTLAEHFLYILKQLPEMDGSSEIPKHIKQKGREVVHQHIQQQFQLQEQQLQDLIKGKNTTSLWTTWSDIVVTGFLAGLHDLTKDQTPAKVLPRKDFAVYGTPTFQRVSLFPRQHLHDAELQVHPQVTHAVAFVKQIRRVQHLVHSLKKCIFSPPVDTMHLQQTWTAIQSHLDQEQSQLPSNIAHLSSSPLAFSNSFLVSLNLLLAFYKKQHESETKHRAMHFKKNRKQHLLQSPYNKAAYAYIANDYSPPMQILQDDQGRYVTAPDEMDELVRNKWAPIYEGNVEERNDFIANYLTKYASYLFRANPFQLPPLQASELRELALQCDSSAPGMDAWTYDDFRLLPLVAFQYLVCLLDLVENGAPWPEQLLHNKAHMLAKDPSKPMDPLQYRLLLLTPVLYRLWGKQRLQHLTPWIDSWALNSMYGGMKGVGASEAWYVTALEVEAARLSDVALVGGALDLYKCFDQILRPLMYVVLAIAGLPPALLTAYINFQENMCVYNNMSGALGLPHQHPCGIPQGCPLSMVFISLYMRAWLVQMMKLQTLPRTLADDLLLITKGSRALHLFQSAFSRTIQHLQELGGKIAPSKSKVFATVASHRAWLTTYKWEDIGQCIPVVQHFRDLGSQLTLTKSVSTTVSKGRLSDAERTVDRISRLPHSRCQKVVFSVACANNQALYGSESAHVDEQALRTYTSKLAKVVSTDSQLHARTLAFGFSHGPLDIDPYISLFYRRVPTSSSGHS